MGGEDWRKKLVRSWDDSLSKIKCRRGCEREAKKDEADLKAETEESAVRDFMGTRWM